MKTPDIICNLYSNKNIQLKINLLENEIILIEGDSISLKFLGELLIAQSRSTKDCGCSIDPKGAGSTFFNEDSKYGLYIHRLPCNETTAS